MPRPIALKIASSGANYWLLDDATINNMQWVVTAKDHHIPIFGEPHACVVGTVTEVIHEDDGDIHFWLTLDGVSKSRFACEITPQQPLAAPKVGQHVRVFGIFRYDLKHSWCELHPTDHWETIA